MAHGNRLMLGTVKPYPPQPSRTRAKTFNAWLRGVGQLPKSAFVPVKTTYKVKRQGRKVYRSSENMKRRWGQAIRKERGGWIGYTQNYASYADYVQGQKQPPWHAQTGWVTMKQAKEKTEPRILQMFRDMAAQLVAAVKRMAGRT